MELTVLGCSGGVGENLRTTTLRFNHQVLIDAGTVDNTIDLTMFLLYLTD